MKKLFVSVPMRGRTEDEPTEEELKEFDEWYKSKQKSC